LEVGLETSGKGFIDMNENILVTGGAGFIGINFVHYLLGQTKTFNIVNLDALTYAANVRDLPCTSHHIFVHGNICDRALIDRLLRAYEISTIVHFAAESCVDRSIVSPMQFIETNLLGTFNLLEAARQYWLSEKKWSGNECRFHHVSTDEVFGALKRDDAPFTEKTSYAPNSPYSASKAGSDHLVHAYFHTYGLPVTLSNCSNNYGPYQHQEKFIPTVIRACLKGNPIPLYGDGSNIRDWLYVTDHCRAVQQIIFQGRVGETYNIGGNHEKSNLEIAKLICSILDECVPTKKPYAALISFVTDRPGHDFRYAVDTTKIKQEMSWEPLETFETGIRRTIQFYLELYRR
jgi:dTDP-glucose 4,6-dehydratase